MSMNPQPPGWYHAEGDPPGTQRYWDGSQWQGGPQAIAGGGAPGASGGPPGPGLGVPPMGGAPVGGAATDVIPELGLPKANPGLRIVGRIVDGVIAGIGGFIVSLIFGSLVNGYVGAIVGTFVGLAYEYVMLGMMAQTVGKMIFGFKVYSLETRAPVDYNSALMRVGSSWVIYSLIGALIPLLGSVVAFVAAIASLVLLFTDARSQTIHDKIGKTVVVKP